MDLLAGHDAEAQNAAEAYASTLDNHYTELVGAAYARGVEVGQEQAATELTTLRQRVHNLEEQIGALTGDPTTEPATPPLIIH